MKVAIILLASLAVVAISLNSVSATPSDAEGGANIEVETTTKKGWFKKLKDTAKKGVEKVKEQAAKAGEKIKKGYETVKNKITGKGSDSSSNSTMDSGNGNMTETGNVTEVIEEATTEAPKLPQQTMRSMPMN